jgi:hypothetical protein
MNNILIALAISISIFFITVFSILYIIINSSEHKPNTKEKTPETTNNTNIYNEYSTDPNYNLINVEYQLLGTLSSVISEPETIILPLYGKRIKSYRWKYYTKVNDLKLDIEKKRNNNIEYCMKECDTLEDGETITVPAYTNTDFIVKLYDYQPPF